jgi:hypothetical protein
MVGDRDPSIWSALDRLLSWCWSCQCGKLST